MALQVLEEFHNEIRRRSTLVQVHEQICYEVLKSKAFLQTVVNGLAQEDTRPVSVLDESVLELSV